MTILSTLWLLPLVSVAVLFVFLGALRNWALAVPGPSAKNRYWRSVLLLDGLVAVVRVAICWNLTYRAFIHRESFSEIPLIALLMPEYLLAPGDPATPVGMWGLTLALVIGSFVAVSVLALLVWRFVGSARAGRER